MQRIFRQFLVLVVLSLLTCANTIAAVPDKKALERQRQDFSNARQALKQGRLGTFRRLQARLKGYPLHAYLHYYYLRKYMSKATPADIRHWQVGRGKAEVVGPRRVLPSAILPGSP